MLGYILLMVGDSPDLLYIRFMILLCLCSVFGMCITKYCDYKKWEEISFVAQYLSYEGKDDKN